MSHFWDLQIGLVGLIGLYRRHRGFQNETQNGTHWTFTKMETKMPALNERNLILMLWEGHPLKLHCGEYTIAAQPVEEWLVKHIHARGLLIRRLNGDFTLSSLGCQRVCEAQNMKLETTEERIS